MSAPNNDKNCTSRNQDKTPATNITSHPTFSPASSPNKHNTTAPEPQQPDTPVLLQRQQHPPPSFDIAHHGWDASNVSTAKCDLCHRQRCGTLQKCRVCKLSICRECCVNGRLQNDRRHAIDAAAVDWDVPPNVRKRKRQAMGSGEETPLGSKRQKAGVRQRRSRGQQYGREVVASSVAGLDGAAQTLDGEVPWNREYGHVDNMEPRLSVAPASYYPSVGQAQHTEAISPKYSAHYELETVSSSYRRLPTIEEVRSGDEEYLASLESEHYSAASAPGLPSRRPVLPADDVSQAAPSRPVLPPIAPLLRAGHRQYHHSAEIFQTSSDILSRLDHLLHHHQPMTNESWPQHEQTDSFGTSLANTAHANHHASSPPEAARPLPPRRAAGRVDIPRFHRPGPRPRPPLSPAPCRGVLC
ncbi:hypothetical protein TrVGV298_005930 [Trichoderma virens]|nr:hypothetical protein TrVGV298_005930 [Trichoderma virens]